jgi:hypothetical protein
MGALSLCNKKYVKITMVLMHKIVRRKPVIIHFFATNYVVDYSKAYMEDLEGYLYENKRIANG